MASRSRFGFRLKILGVVCALGAAALVARMTKLTVVDGPGLRKEVGSITCRDAVDISYRGQIVDRNGAALATSVESFQVAARREEYKYDAARIAQLADALVDELQK